MTAVPLPADHLACQGCGVAVPIPADPSHIVEADVLPTGPLPGLAPPPHARVRRAAFTRCPQCAAVRETAERIVVEYPRLAARLGPDTATHRVECALLTFDALGQQMLAPDRRGLSWEAVVDMMRLLAPVGAGVRWLARLSPTLTVPMNTCTASRWGHLLEEQRAQIRQAQAQLLRARVARSAPPMVIPPPCSSLPGCLMCGVGALRVAAVEVESEGGPQATAQRLWQPVTTQAGALGGPTRPDLLKGYLCPACADAVDVVGAIGPTAMERAVRVHLGMDSRTGPMSGLVGWAGLTDDPEPNSKPWQHCDFSALAASA